MEATCVTLAAAERLARKVRIRHQGERGMFPFVFNAEQRHCMQMAEVHPQIYCLKSRQIGLSTLWLFYDVLWALVHDVLERPVRVVLAWDTEPNVKAKINFCDWVMDELGIVHEKFQTQIIFPNGSELVGITAGGRTPGRGVDGADRLHASELPFWLDGKTTWQGLRALLQDSDSCTIETTMHMREPFARALWDQKNSFKKLFFPFSWHRSYRAPHLLKSLTEDDFEMGAIEGFDISRLEEREALAYWINILRTDCNDDILLLKRDYPQKIEHCFSVAEGRWVHSDPPVFAAENRRRVSGVDGNIWPVHIYRHPEDVRGACVIAVDTAEGAGLDHSVVLVVDGDDGSIVASFNSNTILFEDLARVVRDLYTHYKLPDGTYGARPERFRRPYICIETNNPGKHVSRALARAAIPHRPFNTQRLEKYRAMRFAKAGIERGRAYGPKRLADEASGCYFENGGFRGPKDMLMTYGFAQLELERILGVELDGVLPIEDPYAEYSRRARKEVRVF